MDPKKTGLTVRIADTADAPVLAHFLGIIDDLPLTAVETLTRLDAVQGFEMPVLAYLDGRAAGFACLRVLPSLAAGLPIAELTELYVEKGFTGGEVERALIQQVEDLARQRGVSHLALLTGLKNAPAQSLYRGLGFQDYALAMRKMIKGMKDEG
jgi:GNAT superfamily N-acetyltransferase